MFVRVFIEADDPHGSKKTCEEVLTELEKYVRKKRYLTNKHYWKIDNVFVLEVDLSLKEKILIQDLEKIILSISDKWKIYGEPVNEVLISNTMYGCNMKNPKVIMVNIFFENTEIF